MLALATGSFALLVIILLVLLGCLVILLVKLIVQGTGCTGSTGVSSSIPMTISMLGPNGSVPAGFGASLGPNNGMFYGNGSDRDGEFINRKGLDLKKDAFYTNLVLDASTLNTNGYRLFVGGTLTMRNGAVIQNAGKDGGDNGKFGAGPVPGGLG